MEHPSNPIDLTKEQMEHLIGGGGVGWRHEQRSLTNSGHSLSRSCRAEQAIQGEAETTTESWITRTGAPWRDLPQEFGNWNTVHRRFRRWVQSGVFQT